MALVTANQISEARMIGYLNQHDANPYDRASQLIEHLAWQEGHVQGEEDDGRAAAAWEQVIADLEGA